MAPNNYFNSLSVEVIEHILLQFTRPSDLLSLALAERRLSSIIIPDFLEYCCLSFCVYRWDVWEHLEQRHLACSRVSCLKLSMEHPRGLRHIGALQAGLMAKNKMLPRPLKSIKLGDCINDELDINTICSVVTKMSNLKQISINNDKNANQASLHEFFTFFHDVYNSGCRLEKIELGLSFITSWTAQTEFEPSLVKMLSDSNWLSSLKICRLTLSFGLFGSDPSPGFEFNFHISSVLSRMANLTHLQLITSDHRSPLHVDIVHNWPKLEFFYLRCGPSALSTFLPLSTVTIQPFDAEFILKHPRLHTLYLHLDGVTLIHRPSSISNRGEETIPALTNFTHTSYTSDVDMIPASLTKSLPFPVFKNLRHLTLKPSDLSDLTIFNELESLESCIVYRSSTVEIKAAIIPAMFRRCKKLKKLLFDYSYLAHLPTNDSVFSLFQDLPNLTHLLGTYSPHRRFPGPEGSALLQKLYQFPKLRYIDCYHHFPNVPDWQVGSEFMPNYACVELERDDVRQQMEYEFFDYRSMPRCCEHHLWGDFRIPE